MESKRLYELGIASYNRSNFKEAFEYFNQAATLGSSEAEYLLAEMYRDGKGVNKDFDKSLSLYKKLLDVDDDFSISDFTALNNGQVDIKEVIDWFVKAANEGNQTAENKLKELRDSGFYFEEETESEEKEITIDSQKEDKPLQEHEILYELGLKAYKTKDYETALNHFTKSAELGNDDAMYHLGHMYKYGEGESDSSKALELYKKSAELGNLKAMMKLEFMGIHLFDDEN